MDLLVPSLPTPIQELSDIVIKKAGVHLFIKRDDLVHPTVSGNKWRKLKYSLQQAKELGATTLLTFGGAFSNHIYATAAAGANLGFKTIGIIRGEDPGERKSPTLQFCEEHGMQLHYVSREEYKLRNSSEYVDQLREKFGNPFVIPEGGTSELALKGVREMTIEVEQQLNSKPDYYAVALGTGGTSAGILTSGSDVLAFSSLKGGAFLENDIMELIRGSKDNGQFVLFTEYHFGGYARHTPELLDFITKFKYDHNIQLEQVYTGKMFFGLYDLMARGFFKKGSCIVAVHTGGLQGLLPELLYNS
ncbi:1-aminocyclopropane-1-carboxylate deaminase/D-cysteine desulfhydrase, PLP-dependent ACC family [Dyadobacter koreensis]|uniref:1-aminocyclopropane-1-carboxylate deaminase/D-cysteine desulfhydrase, PLP-dependent ACC family n=1 Tax=Dyadobacter koreensis TaxID=408657 RepID=A0A1H6S2K6_9BACT|nr:pyridoxal-phosphate dependent enzyme [Dyadobacter koreensis]SEI57975.1 1-aminocyclopropane-1-carboxylate deaminase/D-cysteine desulfhydrase, PLP-dependent ACC family [Dyadobacter koreensis]